MKATIIILVLIIICLILVICFLLKMQKERLKTIDSLYLELQEARNRQFFPPTFPNVIERNRIDLESIKFSQKFQSPAGKTNNEALECEFINGLLNKFEEIAPRLIKRRDTNYSEVEMEVIIYIDGKDLETLEME